MVKLLQICAQIKGMAILIKVAQHDNQLETTSNVARGQMYSQTNGGKLVEWKRNYTSKHYILLIHEHIEFPNDPMNGIKLAIFFFL